MKLMMLAVLGMGTLAGACIYLGQPGPLPANPAQSPAGENAVPAGVAASKLNIQ
jgi:hypothetical protein